MPKNELARLKAENRFFQLEIDKDPEIQEIVDIAAAICHTEAAFVSLTGEDQQQVKYAAGIEARLTDLPNSFFRYIGENNELAAINTTEQNEPASSNLLMVNSLPMRFYTARPITTPDGYLLGYLCIMDSRPRELSTLQLRVLSLLAKQIAHLLEFDTSLGMLKQLFIEARGAEIQLRSYFESSSAVYLLLDSELKLITFNKAAAKFAKDTYQVDLVQGMAAEAYVHPAYVPQYLANCSEALSGNKVIVERQINYTGREMWWQMTYEPASNKDGAIIGVSYNSINITERKAQELEILTQNEALKKIAYLQSHELRKPVASIMGLMNVIKTDDYLAEEEDLLMMEKAVTELDQQIRLINHYTERVDAT